MLAFFRDCVEIFQRLLYGNLLQKVMLLFHRMCSKQIKKRKGFAKKKKKNHWTKQLFEKSCRQFIVCIILSVHVCQDSSLWISHDHHWCFSYSRIQHLWDHQDLLLGIVAEAVFHVMVCLEGKGHLWIIGSAVYSRHWRGTSECIILSAVFKALKCWFLCICLVHRSDLVVSRS